MNPHITSNAVNFEVPLRNILFVTDFSPSSELALPLCGGIGVSL